MGVAPAAGSRGSPHSHNPDRPPPPSTPPRQRGSIGALTTGTPARPADRQTGSHSQLAALARARARRATCHLLPNASGKLCDRVLALPQVVHERVQLCAHGYLVRSRVQQAQVILTHHGNLGLNK